LLEPNIVSVVDAPKDRTVTDRDPHELSTDLFPVSSFWSGISASGSSMDFVVDIDGVYLAFTSGNLSESGTVSTISQWSPSITLRKFFSDASSHVHLSIAANTSGISVKTSRDLQHCNIGWGSNIHPAFTFPVKGINLSSHLDFSSVSGEPESSSVTTVDGGDAHLLDNFPTSSLVVDLVDNTGSE